MNTDRQQDSIGNMTTFRGAYRDIRIGVCIGPNDRYEIRDNLGRGGMGEVFLAYDKMSGIEVAIKLIPREVSASEEEMQQIRKNFALVQKLHHPNIAAVTHLERLSGSGEYFLVMEAVHGRNTLHKERLNREGEKIPVDEAIRICKQVAEALDYAHGQKVLHRDIKPANVMVTPDGEVKLTDFGLAAQIISSMHRVSMMPVNTSGTRPYMAPEQWESRLQDERTDQWALAIMFYELVSGWLPFSSNDVEILERQVLTKTPRRPDELSEPQWAALTKALSKNKEDRFTSCADFVSALTPGPTGPKRKRSSVPQLVTAVCIAALVGAGVYSYMQKMSQRDAELSRIRQRDELARQEAETKRAVEAQLRAAEKRAAEAEEARLAAEREKQATALALEQKRKEEAAARAEAEQKAQAEAELRSRLAAAEAAQRVAQVAAKRESDARATAEEQLKKTIAEHQRPPPVVKRAQPEVAQDSSLGQQNVHYAFGRWHLFHHPSESAGVYLWYSSGDPAVEIIRDSNGWWRWKHGSESVCVSSTGNKSDQKFYNTPWDSASQPLATRSGASFSIQGKNGKSRFNLTDSDIRVVLPDGGLLSIDREAPRLLFTTYQGKRIEFP